MGITCNPDDVDHAADTLHRLVTDGVHYRLDLDYVKQYSATYTTSQLAAVVESLTGKAGATAKQ